MGYPGTTLASAYLNNRIAIVFWRNQPNQPFSTFREESKSGENVRNGQAVKEKYDFEGLIASTSFATKRRS